ncbi:MAG: ATP-binding cassette domain-containing protein, partial [Thermoanaerobaculia bacterium]|nr:ATP-binding cassette domain-containing protein [Thermoanaerobaculia bacterium]
LLRVGLGERGHHYPAQLSGGEQQRVALARAFAPRPEILFADEPTGNLDGATGARILDVLDELRADVAATLVLVTHDPSIAERADRRIYLRDGRVERVEGRPSLAPGESSAR